MSLWLCFSACSQMEVILYLKIHHQIKNKHAAVMAKFLASKSYPLSSSEGLVQQLMPRLSISFISNRILTLLPLTPDCHHHNHYHCYHDYYCLHSSTSFCLEICCCFYLFVFYCCSNHHHHHHWLIQSWQNGCMIYYQGSCQCHY